MPRAIPLFNFVMIDTLKSLHKAADLARAKVQEIQAEAASTVRHIEALAAVLTDEEKKVYAAFLAEREKLAAQA